MELRRPARQHDALLTRMNVCFGDPVSELATNHNLSSASCMHGRMFALPSWTRLMEEFEDSSAFLPS